MALGLVLALTAGQTKGEATMCTGAEAAPAAEAAKGATEVAAAGEAAGASATSIAAANAAGAAGGDALGTLIAGNAGTWGVAVAPEVSAAAAPYLAGAAAGAGAGAGMSTASKVMTGASAVNAGTGVLQAFSARRGIPAAPALTQPAVMPTTDDLASQRARASLVQQFAARRGRTSTILSNDTLGGN